MTEPAIELIGMVAAVLTTASFLPQAIMTIRTRNTSGVSLIMYSMFTVGVGVWLVYGVLIGSPSVIAANAVTLTLAGCILGAAYRNRRRGL